MTRPNVVDRLGWTTNEDLIRVDLLIRISNCTSTGGYVGADAALLITEVNYHHLYDMFLAGYVTAGQIYVTKKSK